MREPIPKTTEIIETIPIKDKKLLVIVTMSVIFGILITALPIIIYINYTTKAKMELELTRIKKELILKDEEILNIRNDNAKLSIQMYDLRDFAIASSRNSKTEHSNAPLSGSKTDILKKEPESKTIPVCKTLEELKKEEILAKEAEAKRIKQHKKDTCDLVGLSPREQEETLIKCVGLMELGKLKTK